MNSKLLIGSIVYGAAGIGCKVLAIEGDTLTVETPKGTRKIPSSKVVKVETPRSIFNFKLGDRVEYIGTDFNLKRQYAGALEVWEISNKDINSYACLKPDGRATSWIEFADLQLLEAT
ncbi:hypothetical protein [Chamaesiphon sp.]|uniref:hypothetical protein n=1 Tax=Chamaesiphon sp. TaxID=2814140 RepID=UPI003593D7F1